MQKVGIGGAKKEMKMQFDPRSLKLILLIVALAALSLAGYLAYAATQLSISNSGTVIMGAANWAGATFGPPSTAPSCATATYSQTPSPIAWGNVANDGATVYTGYICIQNNGSARTASISTTIAPTAGMTVLYDGVSSLTTASVANGGTLLITVTLTVALTVSPGSFTYTTTVS